MAAPTPPEVGSAGALPGAKVSGVFYNAGPQAGQPGQGVPGRGHEPSAAGVRVAGPAPQPPQRIAFATPRQVEGLTGCTGIARLGICIRCDRLYQAGNQMHPPAYRDADRVYRRESQVLDGAHVTSVDPAPDAAQPLDRGGVCNDRHSVEGVRA